MNHAAKLLAAGLLLTAAAHAIAQPARTATAPAASVDRRPNIIVFLVDDLGWADIQPNNPNTFYETPNIARLAESGMRFTDGYAACPVCSPSRAALQTGRYPVRTGVTDYIGAAQPERWKRNTKLLPAPYREQLALDEVTIAEVLRPLGYRTAHFGKWHLGREPYWPEQQGYDVNIGGTYQGSPAGPRGYFSPYHNARLPDGPPGEHLPDRLARECVKFIEANRDRPFYANFCFYSVHVPLMAPDALVHKYEAKAAKLHATGPEWGDEGAQKVRLVQNHAVYAGMVESMDAAVGKVLDAVDRLGLTDRTIVVFTSDNGGLSTAEGHPTCNLPLRAGKGWLYEGGIREPLLIRCPGRVKPGSVCSTPVCSIDFLPTLAELAGGAAARSVDGVSLVPLLDGGSLRPRALYWHYPHYGNQGGSPGSAIRDGDWKLIEWFEDGRRELFNVREDPGETRELSAAQPAKAKALADELAAWRKETGARMPSPNPAYVPPERAETRPSR